MRSFAFVNQKGGVGKTTSAINIGAALAQVGRSVLLIDADQSGNLTKSAGINLDDSMATLYEVLKGEANINETIQPAGGRYDVLPSDSMLSGLEVELSSKAGREMLLRSALTKVTKQYDYIFVDCPPSLNIVSLMAMAATQQIIVPVQAHYLALDGLAQLCETLKMVQQRINPSLSIGGIIVTMYDSRKRLHREVMESLQAAFPDKIFGTTISNNIALAEAPSHGEDIFSYRPKCKGAIQYQALAVEIEKQYNM